MNITAWHRLSSTLESRLASNPQSLWSSGKRKRADGQQVCWKCRTRLQWRGYATSDDGIIGGPPPDQTMFPPPELQEKKVVHKVPLPSQSRPQAAHRDWWRRQPRRKPLDELEEEDAAEMEQADASAECAPAAPSLPQAPGTTREGDEAEGHLDTRWARFEAIDDLSPDDVDGVAKMPQQYVVDPNLRTLGKDDSLFQLDYAATFPKALRNGETDLLARCLAAASRADDLAWIRSIDQATFSRVLKAMEPSNTIDKLATAHLEISAAVQKMFGVISMKRIAWEYANLITELVAIRSSAGCALALEDLKTLLRSARDLGNKFMARQTWRRLHHHGFRPDVQSCNYYMAATVFHNQMDARSRHKVRVIPFNLMARRRTRRSMGTFGSYKVGRGGIREVILSAFRGMKRQGVRADEESFRIVITAAAREGDLRTVQAILRKVWGVNVEALMSGAVPQDEFLAQAKTQRPRSSPQFPTPALLFTVAHAYGINNQLPAALRTVDFIARAFELPVTDDVWQQLFEWTFVLAAPRTGRKALTDGTRAGQLPHRSVEALWATMTSEPYRVRPTMGMLNRLIKSLFWRDMSPAILEWMEEGRSRYVESQAHARKLFRRMTAEVVRAEQREKQAGREGNADGAAEEEEEASLERLRREWEAADLIRKRDLFWCKRWLRLALASLRANVLRDSLYAGQLTLRQFPRLLLEWRALAPARVSYEVEGGIVEFDIRTQEEVDANAVRKAAIQRGEAEWLERMPVLVGEAWAKEDGRVRGRLPKRMREVVEEGGRGQEGAGGDEVDGEEMVVRERVRKEVGEALER